MSPKASTGAPQTERPFFLSEKAGACVSDHHSIATGPINRRTRRGIKGADVASSTLRRSGRAGASVNNRPDVLAAQRGGEAARHESVHNLHAVDVARGRHDLQERAVERQCALELRELGGARL